ncbi:hypothetical protein [Agarivorans gilvus]|uniref:Iron-sulfur cluster assembly accessory protein n=1 Tax=Agarivorans gilvus TaxID=680279 RepID=A0ABQ1I9N1_9ALTE|nr:hypothetical protein [Agarivorans gilvus]GGB22412.1 hypothetical protein GCM10007414_39690 [Agarivorans gilvus]
MKLYRMDDEVSIAGSVKELQRIRSRIESIGENESIELSFDAEGCSGGFGTLEKAMIIKAGRGPAFAKYEDGVGIVLTGNIESLKVFASFFDFDPDSEVGCHYHWDEACDSNYVASGTLPIIVAVA